MSREFTVDQAVAEAFPQLRIHLIAVEGLRNGEDWPKAAAAMDEFESDAAEGNWAALDAEDPRIATWHAAYRSFGTNPKRMRPSVEALQRRLGKGGRLPRITPAVDAAAERLQELLSEGSTVTGHQVIDAQHRSVRVSAEGPQGW
jgi:DNA/RNA-binding domain of Phe-tRNA-synthetase-like protein